MAYFVRLNFLLHCVLHGPANFSKRYNRFLRVYPASIANRHLIDYPTPFNFNYFWGFGSLAGLLLSAQVLTGVFLAMHYTSYVGYAFASIEHIMRDVNYGWILRYAHATGASVFFVVVYVHIARGLFYGSYNIPRVHVWTSGSTIFILMMATAFMGYVLPWGQMSFWGATVITNLFTALPFIGETVAYWLWGGFSVDSATLNRFFSLHYFFPFVIVGMVFLHLMLLHSVGSGNPVGAELFIYLPFYPYFYIKDLFGAIVLGVIFFFFAFFLPNYLGHPDNYMEASVLVTPVHIVPEWYFLPFYAILRSIPSKLGGVLAMVSALLVLLSFPFFSYYVVRSNRFKVFSFIFFYVLLVAASVLGWLGARPVEPPFVYFGQSAALLYFFSFLFVFPFFNRFDLDLIKEKYDNCEEDYLYVGFRFVRYL